MTRFLMALGLLMMTGAVAVGCGGDDDTGNPGTSGSSSKGGESAAGATGGEAPATGGETAAGGQTSAGGETAAGGSGNVACDPSLMGVCQNATDCGPVASGEARMAAGTCGKSCLASSSKTCNVDCIVKATKMTNPCASCYADAATCAANKCLALCIADTEAQQCKDCQEQMGCRAAFDMCSGLSG